jgi:phage-related protein
MPVIFYRAASGKELVRGWLRSLEQKDRNAVGQDLMRVQYRWPVGMPLCRPLSDGLWEVRTALPSKTIARTLFCIKDSRIVVLHGFIKKSRKTPAVDLALARRRMKEFEDERGSR